MKEHIQSKMICALRDIAIKYHGAECLQELISECVTTHIEEDKNWINLQTGKLIQKLNKIMEKNNKVKFFQRDNYPAWVCPPCAYDNGGTWVDGHVATFHNGICDVCGELKGVTEPRDFGYPNFKSPLIETNPYLKNLSSEELKEKIKENVLSSTRVESPKFKVKK